MWWRTLISTVSRRLGVPVAAILISPPVWGADLPPHGPLRILITSDGVNPHGLPPELLVEPGDISEAISNPKNGLNIDKAPDSIVEIPTNQIELATEALSVSRCDPASYDVLIYFSHRQPNNGTPEDNTARQAAFVAAVESFLEAGGGVVVFHHGLFPGTGKAGILEVFGGFGQGLCWNTKEGQDVINVAPGHFVTTNSIEYPDMVEYADPANGVPMDLYSFFNNTPDERYTSSGINDTADDVQVLFASNYVENGSTHILGFTHQRPTWNGIVIWYQPGEYQPNALDDLDGNNFQILANEIVFAAACEQRCSTTTTPDDFNTFRGSHVSGDLGDLLDSDDNDLCHEPGIVLNPTEAPITLDFVGTLPNDSPATLDVTIESSANTVGLEITISFWNFNTNSWDIVGTDTQSLNADTVRTFAGIPADHVEPGTGEVRTRYEVRQVSVIFLFPWLDCVDHVFWSTTS